MIYYFSGTGNSKFVAEHLASSLNDQCFDITKDGIPAASDNTIGFVFPVYAWGLPNVVESFIINNKHLLESSTYNYAVMTCGDDIGYADVILNKIVDNRLSAAFSVQMPNTYVCLPGFDVDSNSVADAKVASTIKGLPEISEHIKQKEKKTTVVRGAMPWIKTYMLRPLFNSFLVTDKYFKTNTKCSKCQLCIKECPLHNIRMGDSGIIEWKHDNCTGCLRCYHQCPNKAILFGAFTENKGQKKKI
ncbi:MAG: EFR1 family ferrodoxin [Bacteroidaceae bacterium]|nr:EFR1 family ferrodoxin [Bacteroidaceae bacterium]